ncbi:hypothetical protein ACFWXA_22865 [Streptomyces atroolivaceus]
MQVGEFIREQSLLVSLVGDLCPKLRVVVDGVDDLVEAGVEAGGAAISSC